MARVSARVTVNRAVLHRNLVRAGTNAGHRYGRQVQNAARRRCPVDEGRLRSSIDYTVTTTGGKVRMTCGSPLAYARWVHDGTGIYGPHATPIVPVSAKALKFEARGLRPGRRGPTRAPKGKGTLVFAKSVKGMEGRPFLTDALEEVFPGRVRRRR